MTSTLIAPGEPFPVDEVLKESPYGRRVFAKQSAVLEAGSLIRQMRESAELSQRDLARLVGTSQPHISDLERGTGSQGPTFKMLRRIAEACGTPLHIEIRTPSSDVSRIPAVGSGSW